MLHQPRYLWNTVSGHKLDHLAKNSTTAVAAEARVNPALPATAVVEFMAMWSNLCPPTVSEDLTPKAYVYVNLSVMSHKEPFQLITLVQAFFWTFFRSKFQLKVGDFLSFSKISLSFSPNSLSFLEISLSFFKFRWVFPSENSSSFSFKSDLIWTFKMLCLP